MIEEVRLFSPRSCACQLSVKNTRQDENDTSPEMSYGGQFFNKCEIHAKYEDEEVFSKVVELNLQMAPVYIKEMRLNTPIKPAYMRLALKHVGMLSQVETLLENPGLEDLKILWDFALEFKRNDDLINGFAVQMGLSSEQVDDIFIAAAIRMGV